MLYNGGVLQEVVITAKRKNFEEPKQYTFWDNIKSFIIVNPGISILLGIGIFYFLSKLFR